MTEWQIDIYNSDDEFVETRKSVTPGRLQELVETLSIEMPGSNFVTYPEGTYPAPLDISWPIPEE